jgi:hypothetical protein
MALGHAARSASQRVYKGSAGHDPLLRWQQNFVSCDFCVMCHVVLLGRSMILAPHVVLCILRTVTYARGATKVGFSMTDRFHRIELKRFAPALPKTTLLCRS